MEIQKPQLRKISETEWEIPQSFKKGMNVPALIIGTKNIIEQMDLQVYDQITNVATLPGIVKYSFCMPDGHSGYGFPIGGVAAFDPENGGVISPGGIGFDINCGMRLIKTNLTYNDVKPHLKDLVNNLFERVPAGVGSKGFVKLNSKEFKEAVELGGKWCVDKGYGWKEDLEYTEENGCMTGADSSKISDRSIQRGLNQIGTLGSGNHYLEIQRVKEENMFDKEIAKKLGFFDDQIVIMFHCLPGNTRILTEYGYNIEIKKLKEKWNKTNVKCMNINEHNLDDTNIINFFELEPHGKVYKITTKTGKELVATEDHPILTPDGLKLIDEINIDERVAIMPFEGVEYEEPTDEIIVDEDDIKKIVNNERIIKNLKKKGLLPLRFSSEKLPIIVRLLGFLTGDGWLGKEKERWKVKFIGKPEDLEEIIKDIAKLGYKVGKVNVQQCNSEITYSNGETRKIEGKTNSINIGSLSLPILFYALGSPFGNKSRNKFEVPRWIFRSPLWIKRLYLAGYFGAEMTKPNVRIAEKYRFGNPTISINKIENLKENGYKFLSQINSLLEDFGIEVIKITEHTGVKTKKGDNTIKLRLRLSSKEENLIKLWGKIGYEYCQDRELLSSYATQYLTLKNRFLEEESRLTNKSIDKISVTPINNRSIDYPTFHEFKEEFKLNPPTPIIWDEVIKKEEIKKFKEKVYDFTVSHKYHNFIANNFVVGNCGSRGFGHQVATDYLQTFLKVMEPKYKIKILDRELACAPFDSKEGQDYFLAMKCGVNMSFANRQTIAHRIREVFSKVFNQDPEKLGMKTVYDVAHNTAKLEKHKVDGKIRELLVHRKGATRAFGPGRDEIPKAHRDIGQVVIIGGSMETGSYVLVGTEKGMEKTFGSTAHGAGRTMSRTKARGMFRGDKLQKEMEADGIYIKTTSMSGLAEEAGKAYKDVHEVCEAAELAGISKRVLSLIPIGNVKG